MESKVNNRFEIGGICIAIDTWRALPAYALLDKFALKDESQEADVSVCVRVGQTPNIYDAKRVFTSPKLEIFTDDSNVFRFYGDGDKKGYGEYACTISKKGVRSKMECIIYPNKLDAVPTMKYVLDIIPIEALLSPFLRVVLHASYIFYNGGAILFTAPRGVGKSTQAELWKVYAGARTVNGDRAIIGRASGCFAYGIPYCGSSLICENLTSPLKAVVVLRQSGTNTLRRLDAAEAFRLIYSELTVNKWDDAFIENTMDTLKAVVINTPVYMLSCIKDASAVELLRSEIIKL